MTESVGLALLFVALGALFIGLGVPLARGRVPPNDWYGCRTRATLSNEQVWYAVNRVTGRDMIAGGVLIAACALALLPFARRISPGVVTIILLAVTLFSVGRMAFHGLRSSRLP